MEFLNATALAFGLIAFLIGIVAASIFRKRAENKLHRDRLNLETKMSDLARELQSVQGQNSELAEERDALADKALEYDTAECTALKGQIADLTVKYQGIRTKWEQERNHFAKLVQQKNTQLARLKKPDTMPDQAARQAQLTARISTLQQTLKKRDDTIVRLQSLYKNAEVPVENHRLSALEIERAELLRKISAIDGQRATEANELAEMRRELAVHRSDLRTARADLVDLPLQIEALQNKLAESDRSGAEAREETNRLRSGELASVRGELEAHQAELQTARAGLDDLTSRNETLLNELAESRQSRDAALAESEHLRTVELTKANRELEANQAELQAARVEQADLTSRNETLLTELAESRQSRDAALAESEHLQTVELTKANRERDALQSELRNAQAELASLPAQIKSLQSKLAETTRARDDALAESDRLRRKIESVNELDNRARTSQDEAIVALRKEHAALLADQDDAVERLNQMAVLEAQCDRMRRGMESLETRLDDTTNLLNAAREEIARKASRIDELEQLTTEQPSPFNPREEAYSSQSEKLRALWWENKKLRSELENLGNASSQPTQYGETDQVSALRRELSTLRTELVTLQNADHGAQHETGH